MAIIQPSKKFIGSEIDLRDAGKYIRSDVRQVVFKKTSNPSGNYLYFLPAYKVDAEGNGVWYKSFRIRDNFGDKIKEKYVVIDNDPVAHFERNLRVLYPEMAKVVDSTDDKGQSRKLYPLSGRTTNRVVYNVAYLNQLEAGAHVLDLPSYNGASIIDNWLKEKDTRGRDRPCLNDPQKCIPVFIKLRLGSGAPWQIEPSQGEANVIPDELADSDNLYDLDNIFVKKTPAELIAKLKEFFSSEVFERCIEGYPGYMSNCDLDAPVAPKKFPSTGRTTVAVPAVNRMAKVAVTQEEPEVEKEFVDDDDDLDMTPVKPKVSAEEAAAFLRRPKPRIG
jgi:hypothetical protein